MSKFNNFEELEVWKKARMLTFEIYQISGTSAFSKDFSLKDQIRRAGISVMLNIAEGCSRRSDREFSQFLFIAIGSIAEIQSSLYIALDQKYVDARNFKCLYEQAGEVGRMLSGLVKYLRQSSGGNTG